MPTVMLAGRLISTLTKYAKPFGEFATTWFVTTTWLFAFDRLLAAFAGLSNGGLTLGAQATLWASAGVVVLALGLPLTAVVLAQRRLHGSWLPGVAGGVAFALLGFWLGSSLAAGDWMQQQSWVGMLRWCSALVLGSAGLTLGALLQRARLRLALLFLCGLASLAFFSADVFVLPDLYPDVHLGLYLLSTFCALLVLGALTAKLQNPTWQRSSGLLAGVSLLAGVVLWFGMSTETRAEAYLASPPAARIIERASLRERGSYLEHELDSDVEGELLGQAVTSTRWLPASADWNVILIVNDALRADALPPERSGDAPFAKDGDTPFLDEWRKHTYRFTRAYSQASRTKRSMPPMFQSSEPSGDSRGGLSLPRLMAGLGKLPIAVVPQYFLMPFEQDSRQLLEGFEHIEFFEKDRQDALVPHAQELLTAVRDKPFFAWLHFYNMHDPYFDGKLTGPSDGKAPERYRRALRWLDGQMKTLIENLETLGLSQRTLIVFTADHGESLGERGRTGHGSGVSDEQTRVPLSIFVPGKPGALIDRVVGNIDIVPTVLDLLGRSPLPEHRGRSLVPLLQDPEAPWKRPYYMQNGSEMLHGLVYGDQKLLFQEQSAIFHRFDLKDKPKETRSLFRKGGVIDTWLVRELIRRNPAILSKEIEADAELPERLAAELDRLSGTRFTERVEFLLSTAALAPKGSVEQAAERLFARAADVGVKLAIVDHLFESNRKLWGRLLGKWLGKQKGEPADQIAAALARRGQPAFQASSLAKRVATLAREPGVRWEPWLALVLPWKKSLRDWEPAFVALTDALPTAEPPPEVRRLLLANVASLADMSPKLAAVAKEHLSHENPLVAAAACQAIAKHAGADAAALLRTLAQKSELDVRVRQAVMQSLAAVEGANAIPAIVQLGQDRLLTVDTIKLLGDLKSNQGLAYLEDVVKNHYNSYTRTQARRAIKAIEEKGRAPETQHARPDTAPTTASSVTTDGEAPDAENPSGAAPAADDG